MAYQYRAQAQAARSNNTNPSSHYVNLKFHLPKVDAEGKPLVDKNGVPTGEIDYSNPLMLRNKRIGLSDRFGVDAMIIAAYEMARKEWELSTAKNKPAEFAYAMEFDGAIVPAVSEKELPKGIIPNIAQRK